MSDPWDGETPHLWKWTTSTLLFAAGVALLIGFGAGWTSGRVAGEPEPTLASFPPLPSASPVFSTTDGQQGRLTAPDPNPDAETADMKAKPSTKVSSD